MLHAAVEGPVDGVASGFPVIFSGGDLPKMSGAPTLGMHNQEIFSTLLNLTDQEIKQLQKEKVV